MTSGTHLEVIPENKGDWYTCVNSVNASQGLILSCRLGLGMAV